MSTARIVLALQHSVELLSASVTAVAAALETAGKAAGNACACADAAGCVLCWLPTVYDVFDTAAVKLCSGAGTKPGICKIAELLDSEPASMPAEAGRLKLWDLSQ